MKRFLSSASMQGCMRIGMRVFPLCAALLFISASVWEGAAGVSVNGELPDSGFYVATRSFPRNTIVDVTNLETGRTVRVAVASELNTPGLLAVLSREAADAIGMSDRSLGRIRMSMPVDPVAYSRYTEELRSSGDPDFDPQAALTAASAWSSSSPSEGVNFQANEANTAFFDDTAIISKDPVWETPQEPSRGVDQAPIPPETFEISIETAENQPPSPPQAYTRTLPPEAEIAPIPDQRYEAVPIVVIPESAIIPGIPPREQASLAAPSPVVAIPEEYIIPPIPAAAPAQTQRPAELYLPREAELPPIPPRDSAAERQQPRVNVFDVPTIAEPERGKSYIQLGAYNRPEAVQVELARIGTVYPLAVQVGEAAGRPLYRILLGPINPGETGALLQRFRLLGYRDAFIRQGTL